MKLPIFANWAVIAKWTVIATLLVSVRCQLIDDFTNTIKNNLGGLRTGGLVNSDDLGFRIHHSLHFLMEPLGPSPFFSKDLSGLSLKINYTNPTAGERTIVYLQANPLSLQTTASLVHVRFDQGQNLSVSIPLHLYFSNANLLLGYAFKISGPLIVHCLELITDTDTGLIVPVIPDLHHSSVILPSEMIPDPHIHYQYNLNKLNKQRAGFGITLVDDGVEIAKGGFLIEYIGLESLLYSHIRITYSSTVSSSMRIQMQYHCFNSIKYTQTFSSAVPVSAGHMQTVNIPITKFVPPNLHDDVSIAILGHITIHRITLLKTSFLPNILNCCLGMDDDPILVDDLSTWPLANLNMPLPYPIHPEIPLFFVMNGYLNQLVENPRTTWFEPKCRYKIRNRDIAKFNMRHNNLNKPCGAHIHSKTQTNQKGIHLREESVIFEQLADHGHSINLINADIEIQYSAQSFGSVDMHILIVHESSSNNDLFEFLVKGQTLNFKQTRNGIMRYRFNKYKWVQSISLQVGYKDHSLIIHRISLLFPIPGSPDKYTRIIVDDFSHWQAPYSNRPIIAPIFQGTSLFNYEHDPLYHAPSYNLVNRLPGTGMEILNDGWMKQDLHYSKKGQIRIHYSAQELGTRQIKMTYWIDSDPFRMQSCSMYVVFNAGHYNHVYIPLLRKSKHTLYVVSIQVSGPLLIHQIEMLDASLPVPLPPSGHSSADAFLIDDFSNLGPIGTNALHYKRIVNCELGNGFVTLHNPDQSLVELYRNEASILDMKEPLLRITYSVSCPMSLHISLYFSKPVMYHVLQGVDFHLHSGSLQVIHVPISVLEANLFDYPSFFHGFKVHGPRTKNCPLTIHRLEFTSEIEYSQPIQYKYSTLHLGLSLDYQKKHDYLYNQLRKVDCSEKYPLIINCNNVWIGALSLLDACRSDLFKTLNVSFGNHVTEDSGREFFSLVASAINNLEHDLFTYSDDTDFALEINSNSDMHHDSNLHYYRCIGRIIGMAISRKILMGIKFSPFIYKRLLAEIGPLHSTVDLPDHEEIDKKHVEIQDLEGIGPLLYRKLKSILDTDDVSGLGLYMCVENPNGLGLIDLVKDGCQHQVTNLNKNQFVRQYANLHREINVEKQISAMCQGLWEIIPIEYLHVFTGHELEYLIGGSPTIDVTDWMRHTKNSDGYHHNHPVILNFWKLSRGTHMEQPS